MTKPKEAPKQLPDPMPGFKLPAGLLLIVGGLVLLGLKTITFDQAMLIVGPGAGLAGWGLGTRVQRGGGG